MPSQKLEPFLRWAGGKRRLVARLLPILPPDYKLRRYVEPFFGAGSLYFALQPGAGVIADANAHLMSCYEHVRVSPGMVHEHLQAHVANNSEGYFYETRAAYNASGPSPEQAARFIYLNNTCFNGIFRVNRSGAFNVPYGWKTNPVFPTVGQLQRTSAALAKVEIKACTFEKAVDEVHPTDLFYFDPPYPPLNGTAYFTHYTADRFGENDQRRLAAFVRHVHDRGALFLMSNADTPLIRELYDGFQITGISVTRFVTCKAKKHSVDEVVITNYPPTRD